MPRLVTKKTSLFTWDLKYGTIRGEMTKDRQWFVVRIGEHSLRPRSSEVAAKEAFKEYAAQHTPIEDGYDDSTGTYLCPDIEALDKKFGWCKNKGGE